MENKWKHRMKNAVLGIASCSMIGLAPDLNAADLYTYGRIKFDKTAKKSFAERKNTKESLQKATRGTKRISINQLFNRKERTKIIGPELKKYSVAESGSAAEMTPAERIEAVKSALKNKDGKIATSEKFTHPAPGIRIVEETEIMKKAAIQARFDAAMKSGGSDLSGDPCPNRVAGYEKQLREIENPVQKTVAETTNKNRGRWIAVIENGERRQMWLAETEDRTFGAGREPPAKLKSGPGISAKIASKTSAAENTGASKTGSKFRVTSSGDLGIDNAGGKAAIRIGKNTKGIGNADIIIKEYLPDQILIKNADGKVHINRPIGKMEGKYPTHFTVEKYPTGDLRRNYKLFEMDAVVPRTEIRTSNAATKRTWSGTHIFEDGVLLTFGGAAAGDEVGRRVGGGSKFVIEAGMVGGAAGALGGMYGGALLGTQVGLLCGPAAVPCMAATSLVGAVAGTILGAETVARAANAVKEPVSNALKDAKEDIKKAGQTIKQKTAQAAQTVKKKAKKAKEKVRETAEKAVQKIENTVEKVKETTAKIVDKVKETAKNAWDVIKGLFD